MRCKRCKIQMVDGKAIKNTLYIADEGTCSRTGNPIMVKVDKCPQCGYSVEKQQNNSSMTVAKLILKIYNELLKK